MKCPPFLTFVYPLQNKLIIKYAKNYAFCYRRTIPLKQEISLAIARQITQELKHKFITHKSNCLQHFSRGRNDQPLFVNEYKVG